MSSVLKVKVGTPIKFLGVEYKVGDDITDAWNPNDMAHMQMFLYKQVILVKEDSPAAAETTVAKRSISKK